MATLTDADTRRISQRTILTEVADGDYLAIEDITDDKLKGITFANIRADLGVDDNTTHRTSDGSDHTFIDQDVTSGSSPTLDGANITGVDADNVDLADTDGRYTATDTEAALAEIAGSGRTTETVKQNQDDIDAAEARLSGLDTLVYDDTTYKMSRSIQDGHLVTHYTEVI